MPIPRPESSQDAPRVIAHVDMDCFYVQVEQRRNPELRGLPTAVVQYNSWKGGGLIAVGYEARKFGVKRSMRGNEAKRVCPDIHLIRVPTARGKADLNVYRNAGSEVWLAQSTDTPNISCLETLVVSILATKGRCERASIDEVYLDLTDAAECMLLEMPSVKIQEVDEETLKSHILGLSEVASVKENIVKEWICRSDANHRDKLLSCGAIIVARLRMKVLEETTFTCSAGIAHNKMLAKLASAMNKPAQQTIVPSSSVKELLASLPIKNMKQLGGKLGSSLETDLGINVVGDLLCFSKEKLQDRYGINTGTWLWNIARGINGEEVQGRLLPKSHGCGKTFPGPQALITKASVEHWLNELCEELSERIQIDLENNKRVAQTLTLHVTAFKANDAESQKKFPSKSCPLRYGAAKLKEDALKLFESALKEYIGLQSNGWGVTSLSVSASKIFSTPQGTSSILSFFHGSTHRPSSSSLDSDVLNLDGLASTGTHFETELEPSHNLQTNCSIPEEIVTDTSILEDICNKRSSEIKQKFKMPCSMHKFFPAENTSCYSSSQMSDGHIQHSIVPFSSQGSGCSLELNKSVDYEFRNQRAHREETGDNHTLRKAESWKYNMDNVDPSVIDELPPEIQREVRDWLRPYKHAKTTRRGSSIVDYFSPIKK